MFREKIPKLQIRMRDIREKKYGFGLKELEISKKLHTEEFRECTPPPPIACVYIHFSRGITIY